MKIYRVTLENGLTSTMKAEDEARLSAKILSGHYGVLPIGGRAMIRYTPENIKEIIEITDKSEEK